MRGIERGEFLQDLRVGARQLLRRPGFAVAAIGSLALGIGITTTLFTVVNAVLLKASPLREPARLVELYSGQQGEAMALTTMPARCRARRVSRDHKVRSAGEAAMPYVHRPIRKGRAVDLIVRTAGAAGPLMPALREAMWALEPDAVFTADGPASDAVEATMAPTRIGATLIGVVGVLALLLAAAGLYGVVAYSVSLRTREVGIRMALGAERSQVLRKVLGQGLRLALVGVGLGVVLAAGAATLLGSMLYGVSAFDPAAYGAAAGLLLLVALAANLMPAVTASRIAPATAIRG